jgi:hypothetical protein
MELASIMFRAIVVFPCVAVLVRESGFYSPLVICLVTSYRVNRLCGCLVLGHFAVLVTGCSKRR